MKDLSELRNAFVSILPVNEKECNFYFVKKYDSRLYETVQKNEGMIHTDLLECGKFLRDSLTVFLEIVLKDNPKAQDYMRSLDDRKQLSYYEKAIRKYIRKDLINPDHITPLRELTNTANHYIDQEAERRKEITYRSLTDAFILLHKMMKTYFKSIHPLDADEIESCKYRNTYQQIGDYIVYHAETPAECSYKAQYMCFNENHGTRKYYVIREYLKSDHSAAATRENEVLSALWDDSIEYPQGIVRFQRIETNGYDNPDDARRLIIYEMNGQPRKLNTAILSKWDQRMKLRMMTQLCDAVKNLHSDGIYHRNLNLNSVYVCERNQKYRINLTSFEFSKLTSAPNHTVISRVVSHHNPDLVFTAPEIRKKLTEGDYSQINWEKADIYSLGILLAYIMSDGAFAAEPKEEVSIPEVLNDLEDNYPENLIQLILSMCEKNRFRRPDASQVHFIVRRCYEAFSK